MDEYFQMKAPDVRQSILDSLQRMYNQNEWHDNPLNIICRDLEIHVSRLMARAGPLFPIAVLLQVPTPEQLLELKATRDALKAEYDALCQSVNH